VTDRQPRPGTDSASTGTAGPPPALRRLAAIATFVSLAAALVLVVVSVVRRPLLIPVVIALLAVTAIAALDAMTRRGARRVAAWVVTVLALVALLAFLGPRSVIGAVLVAVVLALGGAASRYAMAEDLRSLERKPTPGTPVEAARRGVLLMNPKSGGGKVEQFHLEDECRRRGIEPIVLEPGDDLLQLAQDAIDEGADVVGMAGGDGSQALVASVAKDHDVAFVCVPAGTRNHFALDLGLDRDDVVMALDAFGPAVERVVDLATVNGRVFVNNVSLGLYATVVESADYRDHKVGTAVSMMPDLLGADTTPFDLRHVGPDGDARAGAHVLMVANNPYVLTEISVFGTRERLDTGRLGIVTLTLDRATKLPRVLATGATPGASGISEWSAVEFDVESGAPVPAGVDGESMTIDPPLEFRSLPGALRVRIPVDAPGFSPAARPRRFSRSTLRHLWGVALGRSEPSGDAR
jgi:diacylglycerol kinase family enzyme